VTGAFLACYGRVIALMIGTWSTNTLYSYGFAVPFIAAYVFWIKSHELRIPPASPDYGLGIPVTLTGVALLAVGQIGALVTLQQISLIVTLTGLLLLLLGREIIRLQWFAVAYLLLMIPIWTIPISHLQDPSRLLSAKIAANLLQITGLPVFRVETNIVLPSHTLTVLRECSGVNQLIALAAMVLPAAYLWLDTNARRMTIVLFAVAISYLSNGVRIALVGWLAVKGLGDGNLNGPAHILQGLAVSAFGYLAIGACFSLLSARKAGGGSQPPAGAYTFTAVPSIGRRFWLDAAILLVMVGVGAARLAATPKDIGLKQDLRSLESRIADWTLDSGSKTTSVSFPGIDDDLVDVGSYPTVQGERRFESADDELVRVYRNASADRVDLYIGYYHRQEDGKELTGEASTALAAASSDVTLTTESGPVGIREIVRTKAAGRRGVLFWYEVNGRIVSDSYHLKGYTILDAITRRRTNGAVVMVAWSGAAGAKADAARERAMQFARALIPVLRQHLPS